MYLVIHTGSRHLGEEVAEYYTKLANSRLKEQGKEIPYYMSYLEGTEDVYKRQASPCDD